MKLIFQRIFFLHLVLLSAIFSLAQQHLANGEKVIRGNRLISVKSEVGKQLYHPERDFLKKNITTDGAMAELEWQQAQVITPFLNASGRVDKTSVRVLYDKSNIYLFWQVDQPDGLTDDMKLEDSVITKDDYVQVDLKPWLPDSILHGRNYSYSIAVNPSGVKWDSYFDPYLGGFFYSSWNATANIVTRKLDRYWEAEMTIPFAGLDVASDPGWKWNLEFHHGSANQGKTEVSHTNIGVTVQQDIEVRQPGLVAYYWARPEFMNEVKQSIPAGNNSPISLIHLKSLPQLKDSTFKLSEEHVNSLFINKTDKNGLPINQNSAIASVGLIGDRLCFKLQAEGGNTQTKTKNTENGGTGMAAQVAGVNGVFVDQSLFQNESFWILLQPRKLDADKVHQDFYLMVINNRGEIKGTHYDPYGTPYKDWIPEASVVVGNTASGWQALVNLKLNSLDIPVDFSPTWGINLFRNKLINEKDYELQAWKSTGNDFLNPAKLGELTGVSITDQLVLNDNLLRKKNHATTLLQQLKGVDPKVSKETEKELMTVSLASQQGLKKSTLAIEHIDQVLGTLEAQQLYQTDPHPSRLHDYPLMDIQFIGKYGWAVGAMGTILRTVDAGKTWERVVLKSDADLYRVKFINELEGWAAGGRIRMGFTNESMRHDQRGGFGYIFHTSDGGKTWMCQYAERGRYLFALDFVNSQTGYASGERGFLLKTTDGGRHWNALQTTGTLNWLYGMAFQDENKGFAVGLNETVLKTIDGGRTWKSIHAPADKKFYGFRSIYRDISFNGLTGCIVGQNGSVLMSHDGGETWAPSATFFENDIRELMDLKSVQFVTPLRGYAVGELGSKIMTTEDGGKNWTFRTTDNSEWLRAVWATPKGKLWVVGEREKILQSNDLGLSWKSLHGKENKIDILVLMAHGDDAAVNLNSFFAYYAVNKGKKIVNVGVVSNLHSSEYEETYDIEMDRNTWMIGVGTVTNFVQFETGNNGANYYHYNQQLWEGEENIERHMVAAIRTYRPDIIITHDGVFGDYDKPEHKVSGRAGLSAFESSGGAADQWPDLTRMGLMPWQPKKLYNLAGDKHPPQSYPATIDLTWIGDQPLTGTSLTCKQYGNYVIRNYQSQGVYQHTGDTKLSLIRSNIKIIPNEQSVFDGLE